MSDNKSICKKYSKYYIKNNYIILKNEESFTKIRLYTIQNGNISFESDFDQLTYLTTNPPNYKKYLIFKYGNYNYKIKIYKNNVELSRYFKQFADPSSLSNLINPQ